MINSKLVKLLTSCMHAFEALQTAVDADQLSNAALAYNNSLSQILKQVINRLIRSNGSLLVSNGRYEFTITLRPIVSSDIWLCDQLLTLLKLAGNRQPIYERSGIGVPLVAFTRTALNQGFCLCPRRTRFPSLLLTHSLTAVITFDNSGGALIRANIQLYDTNAFDVPIVTDAGLCVPLSINTTVPLLAHFYFTRPHPFGRLQPVSSPTIIPYLAGLRSIERYRLTQKLYAIHPFQPSKRSIVFVHGFMSDPRTWLPMINELLAIDSIRERYQVLYFHYPTGQPWLLSAHTFRVALKRLAAHYTFAGGTAQGTILIGHSLGGLIIKTAVQKPNTDLWYQLAKVSPELGDEIEISPQVYLGDLVQWEPVQFVERLVFIASPLKGVPPSIFKESLARIILPRIFSHQSHSKLFDQITSSISYILEDSPSIQFLLHTPMPQTLKWDSIAAVAGANWWHRFIGDLADPLVPLSKSILENSDNVLVVRNAWHMNVHMCDETINLVKSIATLT